MAKKSKTQRAKASAARQQRKSDRENGVLVEASETEVEEQPKRKITDILKKSDDESYKAEKKAEEKAKKKSRFQFLRDVKAEMKRVTWPTRTDVVRWTGVVIVALLFFGVFVAVLDNVIITPLLVLISGIGA